MSEKIKVPGGFEVQAGGQTNVLLDFDADALFVKLMADDFYIQLSVMTRDSCGLNWLFEL